MHICTALILRLSRILWAVASKQPAPTNAPHTKSAIPARECRKNRNTVKTRYLRKYLQQVSKQGVGGVSPEGGGSIEKAEKSSDTKTKESAVNFRMGLKRMWGVKIRLFLLVPTALCAMVTYREQMAKQALGLAVTLCCLLSLKALSQSPSVGLAGETSW